MYQKTMAMATAAATTQWPTQWTREDDKILLRALLKEWKEDLPIRWEKVAEQLPGKSAEEARNRYGELVHAISEIESGRVEVPNYPDGLAVTVSGGNGLSDSKTRQGGDKYERNKATPWTEEEHRLFLAGLEKYKKGEWKLISRFFVVTKTPTQVASHAQKYFKHKEKQVENKGGKRKRPSIHDVTL